MNDELLDEMIAALRAVALLPDARKKLNIVACAIISVHPAARARYEQVIREAKPKKAPKPKAPRVCWPKELDC